MILLVISVKVCLTAMCTAIWDIRSTRNATPKYGNHMAAVPMKYDAPMNATIAIIEMEKNWYSFV